MRAATLSQMSVNLQNGGGMGAKLRLGISKNNASNDNYPAGLLKDAGELDVTTAGLKAIRTSARPCLPTTATGPRSSPTIRPLVS
jgi:hypothetical protein